MIPEIANTDIYLLDQILKNNYQKTETILDAGCGNGRNLTWFYNNNYDIYGVDINVDVIHDVQKRFPEKEKNFSVQQLSNLNFRDNLFNHVICSAVLHFAENKLHFINMFKELVRVLKPNGTLFIRMTTDVGVSHTIKPLQNGVYYLKDQTNRFLITQELLNQITKKYQLQLIEPFKTTVVEDVRSMATIVLQKQ